MMSPPGRGGMRVADPRVDTALGAWPDVYGRPRSAGVYDCLLSGKDHSPADRAFAGRVHDVEPRARQLARAHRSFLGRAVRYLADVGVEQFLDVGTGLPTEGHLYEHVPETARVVCVDRDPVVLSHGRAIIGSRPGTAIVEGDLRRPEQILGHPDTQRVIDFDRPYAVLLCGIVHFLREEEVDGVIATLCESMPPGSYLVLTHATSEVSDPVTAGRANAVQDLCTETGRPGPLRSLDRICEFFDGLQLIKPGVVPVSKWHAPLKRDITPGRVWLYGGVGYKPAAPTC